MKREKNLKVECARRLARIEGQVRGIQRMVDDDRYCADVLDQIHGTAEALRSVAKLVLANHLRHCGRKALSSSAREREKMVDEIVALSLR